MAQTAGGGAGSCGRQRVQAGQVLKLLKHPHGGIQPALF